MKSLPKIALGAWAWGNDVQINRPNETMIKNWLDKAL